MMRLPVHFVPAADGSRVGYAVSGRGPELVQMPCTFGVRLSFSRPSAADPWNDGLSERFQLIQYEGRGHSYGERGIESFTLEELLLELEVLRLLAAGKTNREIADVLVISRNTVDRHVNHIYSKAGLANRAEAASYASSVIWSLAEHRDPYSSLSSGRLHANLPGDCGVTPCVVRRNP